MSITGRVILGLWVASCLLVVLPSPSTFGQGSYGLVYNLQYTPAYPGSSTTIINSFTNTGTTHELVTGITITSDLGTFTPRSSDLPLPVPYATTVKLNMTEQIPSSASVSSHPVTATINFQYQDPNTLQYVTASSSPLTVQGAINVTSNPAGLAALGFIIIGVIVALVAAVVILTVFFLRRRRAKPPPVIYPTGPAPLAGPPPTQTP